MNCMGCSATIPQSPHWEWKILRLPFSINKWSYCLISASNAYETGENSDLWYKIQESFNCKSVHVFYWHILTISVLLTLTVIVSFNFNFQTHHFSCVGRSSTLSLFFFIAVGWMKFRFFIFLLPNDNKNVVAIDGFFSVVIYLLSERYEKVKVSSKMSCSRIFLLGRNFLFFSHGW
jgi:hypothetical protein